MDKRQAIRVGLGAQRHLVHETAHGKMREQQPIALLAHQFRRLAAEHDPRAAQVGLEFRQRRFDLPPLVLQRGEFRRRRPRRIEQGRHQAI